MKALVLHGLGSSPEKINWLIGPLIALSLEVASPTYRDFEDGLNKVNEILGNINEDFIIAGHSMGGTIALLTASTARKIACAISVSGPTDRLAQIRWLLAGEPGSIRRRTYEELARIDSRQVTEEFLIKTSPINYLKPNLPPMLLIHGTNDELVNIQQVENYYEKAKALGNIVELIRVEGGMPHTPRGKDIRVIARAIEDFVRKRCLSNSSK
ncbi:alpha/beta fold hydrolase [Vulcanisaeta souniana]|uniref:alpha/beta hydrolase family protein n=1 Tax=Vulcanisaeta souniana TaxID=164452 RepID=UPI0006D23491|nr:alpha/beta fold hydrolase [Vulcanisaeta souniana]